MKDFNYNIKIPASSIKEADDKISALAILASNLTAAELTKMANVVKNDPIKTSLAKKYLGL